MFKVSLKGYFLTCFTIYLSLSIVKWRIIHSTSHFDVTKASQKKAWKGALLYNRTSWRHLYYAKSLTCVVLVSADQKVVRSIEKGSTKFQSGNSRSLCCVYSSILTVNMKIGRSLLFCGIGASSLNSSSSEAFIKWSIFSLMLALLFGILSSHDLAIWLF